MSRLDRRISTVVAIAFLWLAPGLIAGSPEVIPVRVPSADVAKWFPAGTEWTGMSFRQFETLRKSAIQAASRREIGAGPRLIRASHEARWEDGRLRGRSTLVIAPGKSASPLYLEPWTPAIDPSDSGAEKIRFTDDGRAELPVDEAKEAGREVRAVVNWQLLARPGSSGRRFVLGLPGNEACELTLELPDDDQPEGPSGPRQGPRPAGDPGRSLWTFHGMIGTATLALVAREGTDDSRRTSQLWVSGPTKVDLDESGADWVTSWSVADGPHVRRLLRFRLDPGLELLGVSGLEVEGFQAEPSSKGILVAVRLRNRPESAVLNLIPTGVTIRARVSVPKEGTWAVPAVQPLNAVWTGGVTTIRIDPARGIERVRPLSGVDAPRQVPDPGEGRVLTFEATRPEPVVELTFRKPTAEVSAEVQGRLIVANSTPRLTARIVYRFDRVDPLGLSVDLPRSWFADRVTMEGLDVPLSWQTETLSGGGVRVHVAPPSADRPDRSIVLNISATSSVAGGRGPLALPRVRPVNARLSDEQWAAHVEGDVVLTPTRAKGLAWIDPATIPTANSQGLGNPTLAWRWTADDASAEVDRGRPSSAPRASVQLIATVMPGRLEIRARLGIVVRDGVLRTLAVGLSETVANADQWRLHDESSGRSLMLTPLPARDFEKAGLYGAATAWTCEIPPSLRGPLGLVLTGAGSRTESVRIPLVVLPKTLEADETVLVQAVRGVRTTAKTSGVVALNADLVGESFAAEATLMGEGKPLGLPSTYRRAHAFRVENPIGTIEIDAVTLEAAGPGGVIREAHLRTVFNPAGSNWQRLMLKIAPDHARTLDITLPAGSRLERLSRDGQSVSPLRTGGGFSIPLRQTTRSPSRSVVTVTLDYLAPEVPAGTGSSIVLQRPALSLPCLALTWEVVTPDPWRVSGWNAALTPLEPGPALPTFLNRMVDGFHTVSSILSSRSSPPDIKTKASEFNARVLDGLPAEITLGEWLTRWDAGASPVVIDRDALSETGWGPKARLAPARIEPGKAASAVAVLDAMGMATVVIGKVRLVTTRSEAETVSVRSANRPALEAVLHEAIAWGADASDRFQAVGHWREEPTPRSSADSSGHESLIRGRNVRRFRTSGWPANGAEVSLVDTMSQARWGWVSALAVLATGLWFLGGRSTIPVQAAAIVALFGLGLLAVAVAPAQLSGAAAGLVKGAFGLGLFALGRVIPGRSSLRLPSIVKTRRSSSTRLRPVPTARATAIALVVLAGTSRALGPAPRDDGTPIIALFPYEGNPDPTRPPDRVLLRLDDYRRLHSFATDLETKRPARLLASSVVHRVARDGPRITVESDYRLVPEGGGLTRWNFPVDGALGITATLNGEGVPVRVEPGGHTASVQVELPEKPTSPEKPLRLRIKRSVSPRVPDSEDKFSLGVNPVATATVEVVSRPGESPPAIGSARGPVDVTESGVKAFLGPADRLELCWGSSQATAKPDAKGTVEGVYLWDATPAGDRVRARLTYRNLSGTSMVRIKLGPGVRVRSWTIAGEVDVTVEGKPSAPEWVARINPPLPDGAVVSVDAWRPRLEGFANPLTRSAPVLEPALVERFTGVLGFRRPPEWTGRISPVTVNESIGEEAFVKAWGALPLEPLTLSGAIKLSTTLTRTPPPEVETGPESATFRVTSTARVVVGTGRIDFSLVADLVESGGAVHDATIALPESFRLLRVDADGLTDAHEAERSVSLRFDGPELRKRRVRLTGWTPLTYDPMSTTATFREETVPWPRWPGQAESRGILSVTAPTRFQLLDSGDRAITASEPEPAATSPPFRGSYRVDGREGRLRLRWDVEPPRVAVTLQSRLAINPDRAEWVAVLRYEVSGGPLDTVNLRLPTDWARSATVRLDGVGFQQIKEIRDPYTFLTIRPEKPVWSSLRVVLRSTRPLEGVTASPFPELNPLGRGAVDTYLRVVNQSRRKLSFEDAQGLQSIAPSALPSEDEFTSPTLAAAKSQCYRVVKPGWSLVVGREPDDEPSRLIRATANVTLDVEGRVEGLASFEVGPRAGLFLPITFDNDDVTEILYAAVNGAPSTVFKDGPSRWLIPLVEEVSSRVTLAWSRGKAPPTAGGADGLRPIALPRVASSKIPLALTVRSPIGVDVVSPSGGLLPINPERLEIEDARRVLRRIAEAASKFDRSSRKDGEDLVASIARFELKVRQAERASAWNPRATLTERSQALSQTRLVVRELREQLRDLLGKAGLTEFLTAARVQVGFAVSGDAAGYVPTLEPALPIRVSRIGVPHDFLGELHDDRAGPWLSWGRAQRPGGSDLILPSGAAVLTALSSAFAFVLARRERVARKAGRLALVTGLGLAVFLGGLWSLAGAVGLAFAGCRIGDR